MVNIALALFSFFILGASAGNNKSVIPLKPATAMTDASAARPAVLPNTTLPAPLSGALSSIALPASSVEPAGPAAQAANAATPSDEASGADDFNRLSTMFDQAADHSTLEAYLSVPGRLSTNALGVKTAKFDTGDYKADYEPLLKKMGVHIVTVDAPSRQEIATLTEDRGYYLRPGGVVWVMPAETFDGYVAPLDGKTRGKFKNQLKQSQGFNAADGTLQVGPMKAEDYAAWHKIFKSEVVSREGGLEIWKEDFAQKLKAGSLDDYLRKLEVGKHEDWTSVLFKVKPEQLRRLVAEGTISAADLDKWTKAGIVDPTSDQPIVVGGALLHNRDAERGYVAIRAAAYLEPFKREFYLPIRAVVEGMAVARQSGMRLFSYGTDMSLYGDIQALGLLSFKSSLRLRPYPQHSSFSYPKGSIELIKVLDPTPLARIERGGKRQGYALWTLKRQGPFIERYLTAKEAGRAEMPHEWLGGGYLAPEALQPADLWRGVEHFPVDDGVIIQVPQGVPLNPRLSAPPTP